MGKSNKPSQFRRQDPGVSMCNVAGSWVKRRKAPGRRLRIPLCCSS